MVSQEPLRQQWRMIPPNNYQRSGSENHCLVQDSSFWKDNLLCFGMEGTLRLQRWPTKSGKVLYNLQINLKDSVSL